MGKLASPAATICSNARNLNDDGYNSFVSRTRERLYSRFAVFSALGHIPSLYVSSYAADIKAEFLAAFRDPAERQHYTCHNCLTWLERYGALVFIDPDSGQTMSAFMAAEDALAAGCSRDFIKAISRIEIQVSKFAVSGIFDGEPGRDWGKRNIGHKEDGSSWTHFWMQSPPRFYRPASTNVTAKECHDMAFSVISDKRFDLDVLTGTQALLAADGRFEGVRRQCEVLIELQERIRSIPKLKRSRTNAVSNMLWHFSAHHPAACHARGSLLGSFLDDLQEVSGKLALDRLRERADPINYMRPKAAPTEQAIDAAERAISDLGLERALHRQAAALGLCRKHWERPASPPAAGTLADVRAAVSRASREQLVSGHTSNISARRLWEQILPQAVSVSILTPTRGNYSGVLAPRFPGHPRLLKWDNEYSAYVYHGGSFATQWGLEPNMFHPVLAAVAHPGCWHAPAAFPCSFVLVVDGAEDSQKEGLAIFPEDLRPELHQHRKTIERMSQIRHRDDLPGMRHASGIALSPGACRAELSIVFAGSPLAFKYRVECWD